MEKNDSLLRALSSADPVTAENAYCRIIENISGDILTGHEMKAAIPALSQMISGANINERALRLLAAIAEKGIDISPAVHALESVMRVPLDRGGFRHAAVRALNLHYCNTGREELPVPLPEYMAIEGWRLAGCSRRPLYSDPDLPESSLKPSPLPCPCCGSVATLDTFEGMERNEADRGPATRELLCRECGVYSIYTAAHTGD
jgi:hypothetical protein